MLSIKPGAPCLVKTIISTFFFPFSKVQSLLLSCFTVEVICIIYRHALFLDLVNVFEVFLPQLLLYPNPSDPLNGEAAALMMRDRAAYEQRVKGMDPFLVLVSYYSFLVMLQLVSTFFSNIYHLCLHFFIIF